MGNGQFWGCPAHTKAAYKKTVAPIRCHFGLTQCGLEEPCIRWGSRSTAETGNFWGLSGPFQRIDSLYCGVCSKRDHFIITNSMQQILNNGMTCDATFRQNSFTNSFKSWLHMNWLPRKPTNISRRGFRKLDAIPKAKTVSMRGRLVI